MEALLLLLEVLQSEARSFHFSTGTPSSRVRMRCCVTKILLIRVYMYGYLSGRALGVKNSNKNTSEFLTLCPCLNLWCFRNIFGRYNEQRQN